MKVNNSSWRTAKTGFLGLECSPDRKNGDLQVHGNTEVMRIAKSLKGQLLLTLDSHFIKPEDKFRQDVVLMSTPVPWKVSTSYHQLTLEEAWQNWCSRHGANATSAAQFAEGVENNQAVVDMVEPINFKKELHLIEPELPIEISSSDRTRDEKIEDYVLQLISEHGRLPGDHRRPAYLKRLREELNVIARNPTVNFLPYFLVLHDVCQYARDNGIMMGPGRGSAAGSLLSYLLKITHLDPIEFRLSFARFLSLGRIARGKFPDIDLDFGDPVKITSWLKEKYSDRFSRVCTTGTMKLKGAIRGVSRVFLDTKNEKATADEVDVVCKLLPLNQTKGDSRAYLYGWEDNEGAHPGMIDIIPELKAFLEKYPRVKEGLDGVLDIPRSLGRHASAYCLSDVPIEDILPTCILGPANDSEKCTQFTMNPVEALGLLKMDLLGVNTFNDIQGALNLIKERHGLDLDPYNPEHVPIDDPEVYQDFAAGKTETTFQFNTSIATKLCLSIKPRELGDLSDITANGRPGTMYSLMEDGKTTLIDAWVDRRNGHEKVSFLHPSLEEILKDTYGIFVYQEQLMAAFQKCCGYSEERSDEIREVVGKKKKEQMDKILPEIEQSLSERGWTQSQVVSFISACKAAAGYAFNRSHSACYAHTGYLCGWLKHHYPLEWWTSVMQNSTQDDLKENAHLCREFVVPPDINRSDMDFYIIDGKRQKIVYPLGMILGVKKAGIDIVGKKPFSSLQDFYERVDRRIVHRGIMASLIWAGAFDQLCGVGSPVDRNRVFSDYLDLRGDTKPHKRPPALSEFEVLLKQNESLPLNAANFSELIERETGKKLLSFEEAMEKPNKRRVLIAGAIMSVHVFTSKKKPGAKPMCFLTLTNKSSKIEVTVFNDVYEGFKEKLKEGAVVLVDGKANEYPPQSGKKGVVADHLSFFGETSLEQLQPEEVSS